MGSALLVEQHVTFLELRALDDLRPARPMPGLRLEPVADPSGDAARLRALHLEVGAAHRWDSLDWTDEQWRRWLTSPELAHWDITLHGDVVGLGCLQWHDPDEVEIAAFGLRPTTIGRGYGGAALTELTRRAWRLRPPHGAGRVRRVWLQTTSDDHPHAVPNYRARGFEVCASCSRRRERD